jgi:hypothetical protein
VQDSRFLNYRAAPPNYKYLAQNSLNTKEEKLAFFPKMQE